jgi:RNAse (barnase) inhibitor barstar
VVVKIDTRQITDWDSFDNVFAEVFGFPEWYGRNMDAWIDCMSSLDYPDDGLSEVKCPVGDVVVLHLEHADTLAARAPEIFQDLLDCAAAVNWRRIERGHKAVLALAYHK